MYYKSNTVQKGTIFEICDAPRNMIENVNYNWVSCSVIESSQVDNAKELAQERALLIERIKRIDELLADSQ